MQATSSMTIVDALFPRSGVRSRDLLRDVALIAGFTVLMTLVAQVKIPLPSTPVPITGQTFGVLLTGAALGSRRGAMTLAVYLVLGSMGTPVFAGWSGNAVWGIASGGYIIGFVPAAFVVGWLAERGWDRKPRILLAMLLGNIVLYIPGLLQVNAFFPGKALEFGLWPFIPGDLLKLYFASLAVPTAWSLTLKLRSSVGVSAGWARFFQPSPGAAQAPRSMGGFLATLAGFASMVVWSLLVATKMEVGVFDVTHLAFWYWLWLAGSVLVFGLGLNLLARSGSRAS